MTTRRLIGRESELSRLESYYEADYPRTLAVYGRRRVGKTALIDAFCRGKPHIRFDLTGTSRNRIMDSVADSVAGFTGEDPSETRRRMTDISDLFRFLDGLEPDEKLVVFLDELPDAATAFDDVPAMVKRYVDGRLESQNILLIVCGSSVSGMMSELDDDTRPLFGRFPVRMAVRPLPYREARAFHPGLPEDERMRIYAIASGIPMYHLLMSRPSAADGIRDLFLGPAAGLRNETAAFLSREFRNWTAHERVLEAISDGASTLKAISEAAGMSKTYCADILRRLEAADVVEMRIPYGMKGKSATYRISDGMLSFHYTVLSREAEVTESEDVDWAYGRLKTRIDGFYGHRFEDVCSQYVRDTRHCVWLGFWEGRVPAIDEDGSMERDDRGRVVTEDVDIDVVAKVDLGESVCTLAGECKFTRGRSGTRELRELMRRASAAAGGADNLRYIMFSRSGFTDELEELAEDGAVHLELVTPEDMGVLYDSWSRSASRSRVPPPELPPAAGAPDPGDHPGGPQVLDAAVHHALGHPQLRRHPGYGYPGVVPDELQYAGAQLPVHAGPHKPQPEHRARGVEPLLVLRAREAGGVPGPHDPVHADARPLHRAQDHEHLRHDPVPGVAAPASLRDVQGYAEVPRVGDGHRPGPHDHPDPSGAQVVRVHQGVEDRLPERSLDISVGDTEPVGPDLGALPEGRRQAGRDQGVEPEDVA